MQARESVATTVAVGRFDDLLARGLRGVIDDDPSLELVADDAGPSQLKALLRARRPLVAIIDAGSLRNPAEVRTLCAWQPATHIVLSATPSTSPHGACNCARATPMRAPAPAF
jgi:hypothetical protein